MKDFKAYKGSAGLISYLEMLRSTKKKKAAAAGH
jgi:hypothetical protein